MNFHYPWIVINEIVLYIHSKNLIYTNPEIVEYIMCKQNTIHG